MERKTLFKCIIICFFLIVLIISCESESDGFIIELLSFFILIIGFALIPTYFIYVVFESEYEKNHKQGIILISIFSLLCCFTLSFSFYYTYRVFDYIHDYKHLRSDYKEALENVIDLSEDNVPYYTDSFIEAFPEYYNYLD